MVCAPVRRDNPQGTIDRTDTQTMLYLTCTMISSVDLAQYGLSRGKDCVSVNCGTWSDTMRIIIDASRNKSL